jgi:hypothetical protein
MTFERKCLIELTDILAVHFECNNCHATTIIPMTAGVSEHAKSLVMGSCRVCRTPWNLTVGSAEHKALCEFACAIEGIAHQMAGRNLKLKLEIPCLA